jgi:uncharacterized protein YdhG (YjbR/CyaY superfamily)
MATPANISEYIRNEPAPVQKVLKQVRALIAKLAPDATEKLAWSMPTFYLEGNLLHFAAFKNHMSIFPGSDAIAHFAKETARYTTSKGTLQIPYGQPLPTALLTKIVKFCVKRNLSAAAAKKKKKAAKKKTAKASRRRRAIK